MVKVSILMPLYNAERWVERAARSLFTQLERERCEFIFVDDGSTDRSVEIIEGLAKEHSLTESVKIVRQGENRGVGEARNLALSLATGEYILFVDSDDWIAPEAVSLLRACGKRSKADIITSNFYRVDGTTQIETVGGVRERDSYLRHTIAQSFVLPNRIWGMLIRRELITQNGIRFDRGVNYGEDSLFLVKLLYFARHTEHVDSPLYYYLCGREGSYSNTPSEANIRSYIRSQLLARQFIEGQKDAEHYKGALRIGRLNLRRWLLLRRGGGRDIGGILFRIYCFMQRALLRLEEWRR